MLSRASRKAGALTIAVVAKPLFADRARIRKAEEAFARLNKSVDAFIVLSDELSTQAFRISRTESVKLSIRANEMLGDIVRRLTFLAVEAGCPPMGVDRLRDHLTNVGRIYIGMGKATGDRRAKKAAHQAIKQLQTNGGNIKDARTILLQIEGGSGYKHGRVSKCCLYHKKPS